MTVIKVLSLVLIMTTKVKVTTRTKTGSIKMVGMSNKNVIM